MTKLKLAAKPLEIFIFISQPSWRKTGVDIKRQFHFLSFDKVNELLEFLKKENYISQKDSFYLATNLGTNYLEEYDQFGNDYIFKNQLDFAIISFLYELEDYFLWDFFPSSILNNIKATGKGLHAATNLRSYIEFESTTLNQYIKTDNNKGCLLNTHGRKFYENHLEEKEKKSYNEILRFKSLELSIKEMEKKLEDYEKEKELRIQANKISVRSYNASKVAIIIAGLSLIAFLIQLFILKK